MRKDDLIELARSTGFPRISVYLPTHKAYPKTEQDPIRLSNALKEVEKQLAEAGVRQVAEMLSATRQRVNEQMFWRYQDQGLAVFIEEGNTRWLKLPAEVQELTVISNRYHVLPLIDIFADRGRFHLLTATRDAVCFFDGAEREIEQVVVETLPSSLDEIKEQTDFEENVGYHVRSRGSQVGGSAAPKYHALGDNSEDYNDVELENFARAIARAIDHHLAERVAPLVLAARPRLSGRLKHALRYRHVADADIQRDPASMSNDEVHAQAWAIAGPLLRQNRDEIRARLKARLEGMGIPGSEDLRELMRAADEGRIEDLLIARGANVWGTYDEASGELEVADRPGPGNEDLLNLLAIKTLTQGGAVIALPQELISRAGPVAGLFRY
jgi:hypothetical protein